MNTTVTSNVTPFIWFEGQAEAAAQFYVSIFPDGRIDRVSRYADDGPGEPGQAMVVEFHIDGQDVMALNGGFNGTETIAPAESLQQGSIALFVSCETQEKVDRLWDALCEGGRALPCGWVTDKFGVTWNIVPSGMMEYLSGPDPERASRAMKAMLNMQKLDLAAIRRAYEE